MEEESRNVIAPQNFNVGIGASAFLILLSYTTHFWKEHYWMYLLLYYCLYIGVFLALKRYLKNFNDERINYWITRYVVLATVVIFFRCVGWILFRTGGDQYHLKDVQTLLSIIFFILLSFELFAIIKLGNSLRKIENDFIGLLKLLGTTFAIIIPLGALITFVTMDLSHIMSNSILVDWIVLTLNILPVIIILLIFQKAKKYQTSNK